MEKLYKKRLSISLILLFVISFSFQAKAGDGTIDNPYTVAEIQAIPDIIETTPAAPYINVWVSGYIVGALKSSFGSINENTWVRSAFGEDETINTNVVIADDANETDLTKILPVQLPTTGTIRSVVNLRDTPDNYKAKFTIQGGVGRYFQTNGIRNTKSATGEYEVVPVLPTSIENKKFDLFSIELIDEGFIIKTETSLPVAIYTSVGSLIYTNDNLKGEQSIHANNGQVYFVKVGDQVRKVIR